MRIHKLTISIVLLTVLLGLSIACSKKPSDDTIAKDIQDKIAADPDTKDSQVSVAAKDAKVTLTGQVKTPAAQQKVEQIAREEPGAAGVDDQTAVQPDAMAAQAACYSSQAMATTTPATCGETQTATHCCACRNDPYGHRWPSFEFQDQSDGPNVYRYTGATGKCWRQDSDPCWINGQWHSGVRQVERQDKRSRRTQSGTHERHGKRADL